MLTSESVRGFEHTRIKPWCTEKEAKVSGLSSTETFTEQNKHLRPHDQRTHRANEAPQHRSFRGNGHEHLKDGSAARNLHSLAVLREAVNLHHEEALQQRCIYLRNLGPLKQAEAQETPTYSAVSKK